MGWHYHGRPGRIVRMEWLRIATSTVSLIAVGVACVSALHAIDGRRRAARLLWCSEEGWWGLGEAMARGSFEDTVRAYARRSHAMWLEFECQKAHPWQAWTPWVIPPAPGVPWPDAAAYDLGEGQYQITFERPAHPEHN